MTSLDDLLAREVLRGANPPGIAGGAAGRLDLFRFTDFHEPLKRWPFISEPVRKQVGELFIPFTDLSFIYSLCM